MSLLSLIYLMAGSNSATPPGGGGDTGGGDTGGGDTGGGTFATNAAIVNQLINSNIGSDWLATHPNGFNEFDIIDAADGTGDYELFFDDRNGTKYVRFHNPADLQSKIGTSEEKSIKSGLHYPGVVKVAGRYYLYMYDTANSAQKMVEGNTIAELQAATPVATGTGASPDFAPVVNHNGGYIAAGQQSQARIWTATNPNGPWTDRGFIFAPLAANVNQLLQPQYATNQADGMIFFKDGKCYYLFNGLPYAHIGTPSTSHECIVEIDLTTYKAKGRAVEFIHNYDYPWLEFVNTGVLYNAIANPVYIEIQGRKEVWFMGDTTGTFTSPAPGSIAKYELSADTTETGVGGVNALVNVVAGRRTDLAHNCLHNFYGTVSNTSSGISTSTTGSGLWNFVSVGNMLNFLLTCTFTVTTLPASGQESTVFHIIGPGKGTDYPDKCELILRVTSTGALKVTFIDYGGVANTMNVTTGVTVGVQRSFSYRQAQNAGRFDHLIDNDLAQKYNFLNGMGQSGIYSLLNDKTDYIPAGNQMFGKIHLFKIDLI
jgi:hypothetical protein